MRKQTRKKDSRKGFFLFRRDQNTLVQHQGLNRPYYILNSGAYGGASAVSRFRRSRSREDMINDSAFAIPQEKMFQRGDDGQKRDVFLLFVPAFVWEVLIGVIALVSLSMKSFYIC